MLTTASLKVSSEYRRGLSTQPCSFARVERALMKRILTYIFPLHSWVSIVCVTKAMVSPVATFGLCAS